jgi:H+-translocating NAD(P) transhydrogenase subunit alpha
MTMTDKTHLKEQAEEIVTLGEMMREKAAELSIDLSSVAESASHGGDFLIMGLTVFILACFVGYYVVWRVTPALHSPLMGVTNAISSVIIVGAIIALGTADASFFSKLLAFFAVALASVNIFGGFIVTRRMLHMFKKK